MSESSELRRQTAKRVFAVELNDSKHIFKESKEERTPVYALLPTGEKANRIFIAGTLTEKEDYGEYLGAKVIDPTGTFFVYAGEYQEEARDRLKNIEPPKYVALTGKPRTYDTERGDVNVSIRPEYINEVDEKVRDIWVTETAKRTLERIEEDKSEYSNMIEEKYGDIDIDSYRKKVIDALEHLEKKENT